MSTSPVIYDADDLLSAEPSLSHHYIRMSILHAVRKCLAAHNVARPPKYRRLEILLMVITTMAREQYVFSLVEAAESLISIAEMMFTLKVSLTAIETVCCVQHDNFLRIYETYELRSSEDFTESVDMLL